MKEEGISRLENAIAKASENKEQWNRLFMFLIFISLSLVVLIIK